MIRLSRRRLLALTSATALGGCMGSDGETTTAPAAGSGTATGTAIPETLPSGLRRALAPFPLTLDDEAMHVVRAYAPGSGTDTITFEQYGIDVEAVDRLAELRYGENGRCVAITGSFDASTPGTEDGVEAYREDGFFLKATQGYGEQWTAGFEALSATAASGGTASMLGSPFDRLLRAVGDRGVVAGFPTVSRTGLDIDVSEELDLSVVDAFAVGIDDIAGETAPLSVGIRFSESATVDEEFARRLITAGGDIQAVSMSYQQRGTTLFGHGTANAEAGRGAPRTATVTAESHAIETGTTVPDDDTHTDSG